MRHKMPSKITRGDTGRNRLVTLTCVKIRTVNGSRNTPMGVFAFAACGLEASLRMLLLR